MTTAINVAAGVAHIGKARWATRAQFAVLGILAGAWGAHIPSVKARYEVDEATLSFVLLTSAVGVLLSLMFAGRIVARLSARGTAVLAGLVMSAALAMVLSVPSFALLFPVALVFGAASSLFDVSINAEGSELEHQSGRAIMSNLHGNFSLGGMAGASLVSAMLHAQVPAQLQLVVIAVGLCAVVLVAYRSMLVVHASSEDEPKSHFAMPRGLLLVIGLLILSGMIAEGVMYDWGVLYLKQDVGMPQDQAALGYAAFSAAMALSRFAGDSFRERFSERSLLLCGGALAAVAMAVVLLVGTPWVALGGFVLIGAGLAPVAPILFSAATRVPGVSRAAAIASVTSIGYGGFMVGPPLIGGLAHATSLTVALCVVVVSANFLAFGSRYVPDKDVISK